MNKVILTGNLTKDIEVKHTTSNIAVGNFTIAVKKAFKNANGDYESDFINCVCFREMAEKLQVYLTKGTKILVEGRIQTRSYEANDGTKRYVTEIISDKIEFLGTKKQENEDKDDNNCNNKPKKDPYEEMGDSITLTDEDLPF